MSVLLATVRDQRDSEIARICARREVGQFVVELVPGHEDLAELQSGRLRLMMNGVLCMERDEKELLFVDELLARQSQGRFRLVYDASGIEEGHRMKRELARTEEHTVPFPELGAILDASLEPK